MTADQSSLGEDCLEVSWQCCLSLSLGPHRVGGAVLPPSRVVGSTSAPCDPQRPQAAPTPTQELRPETRYARAPSHLCGTHPKFIDFHRRYQPACPRTTPASLDHIKKKIQSPPQEFGHTVLCIRVCSARCRGGVCAGCLHVSVNTCALGCCTLRTPGPLRPGTLDPSLCSALAKWSAQSMVAGPACVLRAPPEGLLEQV